MNRYEAHTFWGIVLFCSWAALGIVFTIEGGLVLFAALAATLTGVAALLALEHCLD